MHEWMCDNRLTPHLIVDSTHAGLKGPREHAKEDGRLVLNVSPTATRALRLGNDVISFEARFGGVPCYLEIPPAAVLGIYARETGQGMMFPSDDTPPTNPSADGEPGAKPRLKIVK
jgi:stringent starvation protein B